MAIGLAITAGLIQSLLQHGLRRTSLAVHTLKLDAEGVWYMQFNGNETWCIGSIKSRFVHRSLVLLSMRVGGKWFPVALALAADAVDAETFRRLRVALLAPPRNPVE